MSRRGRGAMALVGVAVAVVSGCSGQPRPLGDPDRWEACAARVVIDHEDSPSTQLQEMGGGSDDVQRRFPAAVIDPTRLRAVEATASMTLDGRPIAWFASSLDAVVLDGAAFAPLRAVDVTRAQPGQRLVVGRVTERAREGLGDRGVIELLMRVGAIRTYWHLGSDLCLLEDHGDAATYRARWRGVHHYVADGEREGSYAFVVEVDDAGEVSVTGSE